MLSGQITEGDILASINTYKIPSVGYNLTEIRNMLGLSSLFPVCVVCFCLSFCLSLCLTLFLTLHLSLSLSLGLCLWLSLSLSVRVALSPSLSLPPALSTPIPVLWPFLAFASYVRSDQIKSYPSTLRRFSLI